MPNWYIFKADPTCIQKLIETYQLQNQQGHATQTFQYRSLDLAMLRDRFDFSRDDLEMRECSDVLPEERDNIVILQPIQRERR